MIANRPPDNESLVGTEMKVKFLQADKADQRIILSNRPRATQILNLSGNPQGISWNIGWEADFRLSSFRAAFFHCLRWKIKYMSICSWDFFFRNSLIMHCRIMSVLLSRVHRTSFTSNVLCDAKKWPARCAAVSFEHQGYEWIHYADNMTTFRDTFITTYFRNMWR